MIMLTHMPSLMLTWLLLMDSIYGSCVSERDKKELDILAAQISLEQLKERDQLLCAQNEMLKVISDMV